MYEEKAQSSRKTMTERERKAAEGGKVRSRERCNNIEHNAYPVHNLTVISNPRRSLTHVALFVCARCSVHIRSLFNSRGKAGGSLRFHGSFVWSCENLKSMSKFY